MDFNISNLFGQNKKNERKFTVDNLRSIYAALLKEISHKQQHETGANLDLKDEKTNQSSSKTFSNGTGHFEERWNKSNRDSPSSNKALNKIRSASIELINTNGFHTNLSLSKRTKKKTIPPSALAAAWRILSVTRSPEKEGKGSTSALANRDDLSVQAIAFAKRTEAKVVEMIRSIGEVVVFGEQNPHPSSSHIFEYFCDKNILPLLVEIVHSSPPQSFHSKLPYRFNGVTYTALVKAQVLQSVSILIANVQDSTSLYYLLSNNCVNQIVMSMLPLNQFTDEALEELMPTYISFKKTLALQLAAAPHLFTFYIQNQQPSFLNDNQKKDHRYKSKCIFEFPLFSASVEVATSSYAKSDAFVHLTALNIILNICQIPSDEISKTIGNAIHDQRKLFFYLCAKMNKIHSNLIYLLPEPSITSPNWLNHDISNIKDEENDNQFKKRADNFSRTVIELQDQIHFINDLLRCGVRSLNVRLCEFILRNMIFNPLLEHFNIDTNSSTNPLSSSNDDLSDFRRLMDRKKQEDLAHTNHQEQRHSISLSTESEAGIRVSALVLIQFFLTMEYPPLLRMIVVSLLHPKSLPPTFLDDDLNSSNQKDKSQLLHKKEYNLTTALHNIVATQNDNNKMLIDDTHLKIIPNPYRSCILRVMSGDFGDKVSIPVFLLFQCITDSKSIDKSIFDATGLTPNLLKSIAPTCEDDDKELSSDETPSKITENAAMSYSISLFEEALQSFLTRFHNPSSPTSLVSIECAGSAILSYISLTVKYLINSKGI